MTSKCTENGTEPRRLTAEELQKSVERLTRTTRQPTKLPPVVAPTYISQEDLDKRIKHLYDDSLERRARERAEIDREVQAAMTKDAGQTSGQTLSHEDEERMVYHLYDETLAHKKQKLEELDRQETMRYKQAQCPRTWTQQEEKDIADKLYRGGMERERNKRIALYEQYVVSRRSQPLRRTAAQLAMSADKMTNGDGLAS